MDDNECYTQKQALDLLKITRQTLTRWRSLGIIQVIKIDKKILIKKSEVDRLLKENEDTSIRITNRDNLIEHLQLENISLKSQIDVLEKNNLV